MKTYIHNQDFARRLALKDWGGARKCLSEISRILVIALSVGVLRMRCYDQRFWGSCCLFSANKLASMLNCSFFSGRGVGKMGTCGILWPTGFVFSEAVGNVENRVLITPLQMWHISYRQKSNGTLSFYYRFCFRYTSSLAQPMTLRLQPRPSRAASLPIAWWWRHSILRKCSIGKNFIDTLARVM